MTWATSDFGVSAERVTSCNRSITFPVSRPTSLQTSKEDDKKHSVLLLTRFKYSVMEGEDADKNGKWYPGKFMGKAMRRTSSTTSNSISSSSHSTTANAGHIVNTPKADGRRASVRLEQEAGNTPERDEVHESYPRVPLATVRVKIHEVRFLTIKAAKLSIELDDMAASNLVSDWTYPIVRDFELLNIASDIRLEFRGSGSTPYGVVIVPVTSLLKFTGAPAPAKQTWREIYPYYDKVLQEYPRSNLKFRGGLAELPGSAMNKPLVSLGFVSFEAEILLPSKLTNVLSLYFCPAPMKASDRLVLLPHSESEYNDLQLAVNQARIQRDIQRVKTAVLKPPASVELFMSLPEIFVLVVLLAFIILSVSSYQVPLVIALIGFFNG